MGNVIGTPPNLTDVRYIPRVSANPTDVLEFRRSTMAGLPATSSRLATGKRSALCVACTYEQSYTGLQLASAYRDVDRIHDFLVGMWTLPCGLLTY